MQAGPCDGAGGRTSPGYNPEEMSDRSESTRPPLVFRTTINASPETVFQAFFDHPERWLCRTGLFEQQPDGRLRLCWQDGCVEGRLAQFEPPRVGRFSWHFEGDPLPETMVVVGIEPTQRDGGPWSVVEVEHYGFGIGPDWEPLYLGAIRAWAGYVKNLRAVVEANLDLREADE